MTKKADSQPDDFEKLVNEFIEHRTSAGFHLLKMAQTFSEANHRLSNRMFLKFLRDSRINIKQLQANKMIAVYDASKTDSRLTHFLNKAGIEKSYLITTITDAEHRNTFTEKVLDVPFTVKQTKEAIKLINAENKNPAQAIEVILSKPKIKTDKKVQKTVSFEDYEKLKNELELLKQKLAEFQKKQPEKPAQKVEEIKEQQPLGLQF